MTRRILAVIACGFGCVPGFAQNAAQPPSHPAAITEFAVFRFMFHHVVKTEAHADRLKSLGLDDSPERHRFKKAAKLTDDEETLLKNTAADGEKALADFDRNGRDTLKALKAQYPNPSAAPASVLQQLRTMDSQRQQIVTSHINSMKAAMSADRFQQFYSFAWGFEAPNIKVRQIKAPPAAVAGAPPPAKGKPFPQVTVIGGPKQ